MNFPGLRNHRCNTHPQVTAHSHGIDIATLPITLMYKRVGWWALLSEMGIRRRNKPRTEHTGPAVYRWQPSTRPKNRWQYRAVRVLRKGGARMNSIHIERFELQARAATCGVTPPMLIIHGGCAWCECHRGCAQQCPCHHCCHAGVCGVGAASAPRSRARWRSRP